MPLSKLLLVDDDPAGLHLLSLLLEDLRAEIHPFTSSIVASRQIDRQKYDCIFLDLLMPGLNGFELAQMVRQSDLNRATPVVIVSGRDESDTFALSFSAGATFFLHKPIDRAKLSELLHTIRKPLYEQRRRCNRVPLQTAVTCAADGKILEGISWNVSQGGIQLEVPGLESCKTIQMSFRLPGSTMPVEATGDIVWASDGRQGVFFTNMSVQHQQLVREYVMQLELSPR